MFHRHPRFVQLAILSLVTLIAAVLAPALADATPAHPAPTIQSVQKKLNKIQAQNSALVEQYNKAKIDLAKKQKAAVAAQNTAVAAAAAFEQAKQAVSDTEYAQYTTGAVSGIGALMETQNPQTYLQSLSTQSMLSRHTAQVAANLDAANAAATQAAKNAAALVKSAKALLASLTKQKADLDKAFAKWNGLLNSLTATQRQAYQKSFSTQPTVAQIALIKTAMSMSNIPGAAQKAVDFALAQQGKRYVFATAGPDTFDCSGLTMAAYASAGISLPHDAAGQYDYGTHINYSSVADLLAKLKPGDLIFYYSPIGHVVIYVGNGQAMSASTEGVPLGLVTVGSWDSDQITGATRIASS